MGLIVDDPATGSKTKRMGSHLLGTPRRRARAAFDVRDHGIRTSRW